MRIREVRLFAWWEPERRTPNDADFRGAIMRGAALDGVDLKRTHLSDAEWVRT